MEKFVNVISVFMSGLVFFGKNSLLKMSVVVVLYRKKLYYLSVFFVMDVNMICCRDFLLIEIVVGLGVI